MMKNVCAGTCIGDKDYYYNREIVNDRPFGYGVAIMFYDQYQLLKAQK
ncbi:glycoside hydrolase family 88 protein [Bacteroides sp. BFG-551]|nr:glycoside hydrolase family 88 protein [Bacteroides sp. BFG-551]